MERRRRDLPSTRVGDMIRKAVIMVCLLLALTTLAVGLVSYHKEIVCLGSKEGITWSRRTPPIFATQNDFTGLTRSPRTSFAEGTFVHLWTTGYSGQLMPVDRTVNRIVFRWRQSSVVLFRTGPSDIYFAVFKGIAVNQVCVPLWGPLILFLLYPAAALVSGPLRRYRRRRQGLCLTCGYSLTGNVSGVCPECGSPCTQTTGGATPCSSPGSPNRGPVEGH